MALPLAGQSSQVEGAMDVERLVMEALKQFFSAPIAKALYTSTVRRAGLEGVPLDAERGVGLVRALERALPSYLGDPQKQRDCMLLLRNVATKLAGPGAGPAAVPSERPSDRSGEHVRLDESMVVRRNALEGMRPAAAPAPAAAPPQASGAAATVIRINRDDDVVNAWEVGRDLCRGLSFGAIEQTKIATAISELARNVLMYAGSGEVQLRRLDAPRRGIEIIATDRGPGIPDVATVMSDSYKSRTGMGVGLRGTKKLMDDFHVASTRGVGTTVTARKYVK